MRLILRRHWMTILRHAFWFMVQMILPVGVAVAVILMTEVTIDVESITFILVILGLSLYYLFVLLFFYADLIDYHLDIWVVTDRRLISIEQIGLFNRVVAQQPIEKIQDVTQEVKGKLQTLLDYGNVHIQTAGEQQRFVFEEVPKPDLVAKLILKTHDAALHADDIRRAQLYHSVQIQQPTVTPPPLNPTIHPTPQQKISP